MTIVLILASFGLIHAQTTATVFGNVVNTNGQPVPNWPVFQDFVSGQFFTSTQSDGSFQLSVYLNSGSTTVHVGTVDCDGKVLLQTVDLSLPSVPVIFTICDSVNVLPSCQANFSAQQSQNLTIDFYGYAYDFENPNATFDYTWDFGDGNTGTGEIVTHTYAAGGIYSVELTATNGICTTSTVLDVEVIDLGQTKNVVVKGVVLNEDDLTPIPFAWVTAYGVIPGLGFSASTGPDGSYSLNVLVSDTASTVLVETYDYCAFTPIQQFVPITGDTVTADFLICADSIIGFPPTCQAYITYTQIDSLTYQFSAIDWDGNPIIEYHWDFGDGTTSTEPNPIHTFSDFGIYNVTLKGLAADTCVSYACEIICVFGDGVWDIDTFYYGCQAYFTAYPVGFVQDYRTFQFESLSWGQISEYFWDFGDGTTSTEPNPVHTYSNDGTYNVSLTIETVDGCESSIVMAIVTGHDPSVQWGCQAMFLPLPILNNSGALLSYLFYDMSYAPDAITSYYWNFGDGATSTEQNPIHTYAQSGVYTVSLTIVSDSCTSMMTMTLDTDNPMAVGPTGAPNAVLGQNSLFSATEEVNQVFSGITLYPNPTTTQAAVTFESKANTSYTYTILDLNGRVLSTRSARAVTGKNLLPLQTADLNPGLHLLRIQTEQGVHTIKFVKE